MNGTSASQSPAPETLPVEAGTSAWPAPAGVLASAEGIQAALGALGFEGAVRREGEVVTFSAVRRSLGVAALVGALTGIVAYLVADRLAAEPIFAVAGVVLTALLAPLVLVPAYTLVGRVENGRVVVTVGSRGLFARSRALEKRLRFYLERPAPGRPPA